MIFPDLIQNGPALHLFEKQGRFSNLIFSIQTASDRSRLPLPHIRHTDEDHPHVYMLLKHFSDYLDRLRHSRNR